MIRAVVFVLVEADVGEELAYAVVAERRVGEGVAGLGARAALDVFGVDRDGARGDPGGARDHPFPAVLDRLDTAVVEAQVGLVVHAVEALHDGLLQLVDDFGALARVGVDLVDPLVVHLHLEILRPAAIAAQPAAGTGLGHRALHASIVGRARVASAGVAGRRLAEAQDPSAHRRWPARRV